MSQPLSEILTWDDEQWEVFVHDWLIVCKSDDYPWSERLGGAGDKGRDVVGYKSDPNVEVILGIIINANCTKKV